MTAAPALSPTPLVEAVKRRSCTDKRRFRTMATAEHAAAVTLAEAGPPMLAPYICRYGKHWHLTSVRSDEATTASEAGVLTNAVVLPSSPDPAVPAMAAPRCDHDGEITNGVGDDRGRVGAIPGPVIPDPTRNGIGGRVVDAPPTPGAAAAAEGGPSTVVLMPIPELTAHPPDLDGPGHPQHAAPARAAGSIHESSGDELDTATLGITTREDESVSPPDSGPDHPWTDDRTSSVGARPGDAGGVQSAYGDRPLPIAPTSPRPARGGRKQHGPHPGGAAPPVALGPGPYDDVTHTDSAGSERVADGGGVPLPTEDRPRTVAPVILASDSGPDQIRTDTQSSSVGSEGVAGDEVVLPGTGDRTATVDLITLHAVMSHYSRELLDVQKLRIAQGNRLAAMERDGIPEELTAFARDTLETLITKERALGAYLGKQAKRHPLAPWIAEQRGIGLPGFARLVGITGPLDRFATVSKLWAYLGMHTVDGVSPRKRKGERANWSHQGRVLCHQLGESIVKVGAGSEYRLAYDTKKSNYETTRPEWTPAHRHAAAQRYSVKLLLKRLWIAWRAVMRETEVSP